MQPVYSPTRREAGPILNVLLVFVVITVALGAACLGIGAKIGDSFSSVSSVGTSFWWGGLVLILLGIFYIPCHILVKFGHSAGRPLFIVWTFLIGIGVLVILVSTAITGLVWALVKIYDASSCTYTQDGGLNWQPQTQCIGQCNRGLASKFSSIPTKTCCCCDTAQDVSDYKIVYAKDVSGCDIFTDSFDLSKALTVLYIISLVLVFINMVLAYVVACSCCAVQSPWVAQTTTTSVASVQQPPAYAGQVAYPVKA